MPLCMPMSGRPLPPKPQYRPRLLAECYSYAKNRARCQLPSLDRRARTAPGIALLSQVAAPLHHLRLPFVTEHAAPLCAPSGSPCKSGTHAHGALFGLLSAPAASGCCIARPLSPCHASAALTRAHEIPVLIIGSQLLGLGGLHNVHPGGQLQLRAGSGAVPSWSGSAWAGWCKNGNAAAKPGPLKDRQQHAARSCPVLERECPEPPHASCRLQVLPQLDRLLLAAAHTLSLDFR